MCAVGEQLRAQALRRAESFSMLVLQMEDLPELERLFGRAAAHEAGQRVLAEFGRIAARGGGFATRTASDTFTLLMPGGAEDLVEAIEARLGKACAIEFELAGQEILLVPDVLARRVRSGESVRDAYRTLLQDIVQARTCAQRRQDYLRRERESHSMPAPLAPARGPRAGRHEPPTLAAVYPPLPHTIRLGPA